MVLLVDIDVAGTMLVDGSTDEGVAHTLADGLGSYKEHLYLALADTDETGDSTLSLSATASSGTPTNASRTQGLRAWMAASVRKWCEVRTDLSHSPTSWATRWGERWAAVSVLITMARQTLAFFSLMASWKSAGMAIHRLKPTASQVVCSLPWNRSISLASVAVGGSRLVCT